jgi:hypothetical protein
VVDIFVRHANWDPHKRVKGMRRSSKAGGLLFFEEKDYKGLKEFCPKLLTNEYLDQVLMKLQTKLKKIPKTTAKGIRRKIMATEFDSYEEPLQTWIEAFRTAARRKMDSPPDESDDDVMVVEEDDWVKIPQADDVGQTKHGFFCFDMFEDHAFEILEETAREFTAVHLHLPKTLGQQQGGDITIKNSVERLLTSLIEVTTSTTLAVKVPLLCLPFHFCETCRYILLSGTR